MIQTRQMSGYRGIYLFGFLVLGVVGVRALLFYRGQPQLVVALLLLATQGLLYAVAPLLSARFERFRPFYFALQTALVLVVTNLRPFLDVTTILYIPLFLQALRALSRQLAFAWMILSGILLSVTLILGMGWANGLAFDLLLLSGCAFLVSYDLLSTRTQADEAESQVLLAELQQAHRELQEHAAQAEELASARERNRLARELHDSVSQVIFGITLTSQSARLLLDRDPTRVPEQLDRLQKMTSSTLGQLRSLIAQLRPPQNL
jgi:glucose-6-phosphate-specific signal transduction histidine kinase